MSYEDLVRESRSFLSELKYDEAIKSATRALDLSSSGAECREIIDLARRKQVEARKAKKLCENYELATFILSGHGDCGLRAGAEAVLFLNLALREDRVCISSLPKEALEKLFECVLKDASVNESQELQKYRLQCISVLRNFAESGITSHVEKFLSESEYLETLSRVPSEVLRALFEFFVSLSKFCEAVREKLKGLIYLRTKHCGVQANFLLVLSKDSFARSLADFKNLDFLKSLSRIASETFSDLSLEYFMFVLLGLISKQDLEEKEFQETFIKNLKTFIADSVEDLDASGCIILISSILSVHRELIPRILTEDVCTTINSLVFLHEDKKLQGVFLQFLDILCTTNSKMVLETFSKALCKIESTSSHFALCRAIRLKINSLQNKEASSDLHLKDYKVFRDLVVSCKEVHQNSIEAIMNLSLNPLVKEEIASDTEFLKFLIEGVSNKAPSTRIVFAGIIENLTSPREYLSEEKQKLKQIMEKAGKKFVGEEYNSEEHVARRVKRAVDLGVLDALKRASLSCSPLLAEVLGGVYCNISREVPLHGLLMQSGGVQAILKISDIIAKNPAQIPHIPAWIASLKSEDVVNLRINTAAMALAKILIHTDLRLALHGENGNEVVRHLLSILDVGVPIASFECLMALTNLSAYDRSVSERMVSVGILAQAERMAFDQQTLIQRASLELICNLVSSSESAFKIYTDKDTCRDRVSITCAFCGSEDLPSISAASGTLAVITSDRDVCDIVINIGDTKLDVILNLIDTTQTKDKNLNHRGAQIVHNIACSSSANAQKLLSRNTLALLEGLISCTNEDFKEVALSAKRALKLALKLSNKETERLGAQHSHINSG